MPLRGSRTTSAAGLSGLMLLLVGLGVRAGTPGEGWPIIPAAAPVVPTIPAPVPPASHYVKFQNLIPGQPGTNGKGENGRVQPIVEAGPELSLGECLAVAIERQPSLKAVRASLETTQSGYRSLMNFGTVGTWISPDLEIRKQQAQRGLAASAGEYQKANNELIQDVTRLYYSAVYAKQQEEIADLVVGKLEELIKLGQAILDSAKTPADLGGFSRNKLSLMKIGRQQALELRLKAHQGRKQALAALRQVMAVDEQTFPFRVKDAELPLMAQKVPLTKEFVVEQALCRRPELAMAAAGVDVFRLEVYAQGKIPFKRVVPTFASGADLHAKEIPQAVRTNKEYRPGGIIPEMPTQLVGSKFDRVNRALGFSQKAEAVFESARNLIVLEAEVAFFDFESAAEKVAIAKEKLTEALELQKRVRLSAQDIKDKEVIVQTEVLASKAESDYVEAVFEHLMALAALERITAGGIKPAFPGR